jgi:two-component system phosphate regulon sensor histidine kinase PhoR
MSAIQSTPSLDQLRAILDRMAEGVLSMTAEGRIVLANAAARRLLGLSEQNVLDPGGPGRWGHHELHELVSRVLRTGQPQTVELTVYRPDERILQVHITGGSSEDPQATVELVLHDVTELRRLERVRQDFVANVSHELRTPLTSVKGFIETLLQGAIDDPEHNRRFLTLVEEDVNRLARLTDDLLELSKVESLGKPKTIQSVDVGRIIDEVFEALEPQIQAKRITSTVPPHGRPIYAKGDPDQIRQVFWNLLDNAIKYNVEGGRVDVVCSAERGWMSAQVIDTGIGIPTEELPRIFERFYRVDKARSRAMGGTGLGLSIVKHIVEAHGGQIDVTSEPGRGSAFQLTLPLWNAA